MKITYIANIRIPTEKAHGYQISKLCESFARAGHEVELVVPMRGDGRSEDVFEQYELEKNFTVTFLPTLNTIEYGKIGFWIQTITFNFFVLRHLASKKTDLIYSRDEFTLYLLSIFKSAKTDKKNRSKLFWESHVPKRTLFARRVVEHVDKVVTITRGLQDFYVDTYHVDVDKFVVAPSGVDVEKFSVSESRAEIRARFGLPASAHIVEYVGAYRTMEKAKGVDDLIRSFSQILVMHPDAFLLFVGVQPAEHTEVEMVCEKAGIDSSHYTLVSHVGRGDIPLYLKAADVLVMNYPDTEHYGRYMSPVKMFEYMASGVPIVTTDLPSIREVLNDTNAILVREGELADGIIRLLTDPALAERLATQARRDVTQYSWTERVRKILQS